MTEHDRPSVPLAWPDIGPDEEAEVLAVLRSGRLALGPETQEFERLAAAFTGSPWAVAVSSGTAGLHLAVRALGVGPEDCVVMSSFTFISAANAARYEGAEPVFVDIDPETLCLSPVELRRYLEECKERDGALHDPLTGRRVAAVLTTDVFGHPAELDAILDVTRGFEIPLISDSCESLGSRYRRRGGEWVHAGSGAHVAVFGFYPNKQITTGEGGMVTGADPDVAERLLSMRNQGRRTGDPWLHHTRIGFNYRLDELSAALGVAQMRRIDEILERRAQVARWYDEEFADVEGVATPLAAEWADPAWFVYFVRTDPGVLRDRLVQHLVANGVESKAYFDPPVHRQPPYAGRDDLVTAPLPVTDDAAARTMILPFFSLMTREQVQHVAGILRSGLVDGAR